jgi:hypothetical protein
LAAGRGDSLAPRKDAFRESVKNDVVIINFDAQKDTEKYPKERWTTTVISRELSTSLWEQWQSLASGGEQWQAMVSDGERRRAVADDGRRRQTTADDGRR